MSKQPTRAALIRATFDTHVDLLFATSRRENAEIPLDAKATEQRRGQFRAEMEKQWPNWQGRVCSCSNDVLNTMLEDHIELLNALGLLQWRDQREGSQQTQPQTQAIRTMLDDIEAVTQARYYEDPDPIASPIEMLRVPQGQAVGEPFASLSAREKVQVLGDYTDWQSHEDAGVSSEQMDRVFANVIGGLPRQQWLEGTGLEQPQAQQKISLDQLRQQARCKAEEPQSQAKTKDHDLDRDR